MQQIQLVGYVIVLCTSSAHTFIYREKCTKKKKEKKYSKLTLI